MSKNNPLSPKDRQMLRAKAGANWIPPKPADTLLPYIEKNPVDTERDSVEARRAKAKKVYDDYGQIMEDCKKLQDDLSKKCKDVKVTLNPADHLNVINALRRVFGFTNISEITFDMYKTIIKALADLENAGIPKPGDL